MATITPDRLALEAVSCLTSEPDADRAFELFQRHVAQELEFDWISINVLGPGSEFFVISKAVGDVPDGRSKNSVRPLEGSQTEHVVNTGSTLVRGNITEDFQPRTTAHRSEADADSCIMVETGIRSCIMAPLTFGGRIIGTLCLRSRRPYCYQEREQRIVESLASAIAPWIESDLLKERIRRQHQWELLNDKIISCESLENLPAVISAPLRELLEYDSGRIVVFDAQLRKVIDTVCVLGTATAEVETTEYQIPLDVALECCQSKEIRTVFSQSSSTSSIGTVTLIVPLGAHQESMAALLLDRHSGQEFTEDELLLLEGVASHIVPLLSLEQVSRSLANRDLVEELARPLTSTLDLESVYEGFARGVQGLVDFDRIVIVLRGNEEGTEGIVRYFWGPDVEPRQMGEVIPLTEATSSYQVLQTGQVIIEQDLEAGPRHKNDLENLEIGMRSKIRMPLVSNQKVIGTLGLHSRKAGAFGLREQHLLESLSDRIAPAIENAELHFQLKRSFEEQEVVDRVAKIVASTLNIDEEYEEFARELKTLVDFDRLSISLIDAKQELATVRYFSGIPFLDMTLGSAHKIRDGQTWEVVTTGRSVIRDDIISNPRFPNDLQHVEQGLRSGMMVPLISKGTITGVLALKSRRPGAYGKADLRIVERLAYWIAPAIENAELHSQTQRAMREQQAADEVAKIVTSTLDIDQVFDQFEAAARKYLEFDRMVVHKVDADAQVFSVQHISGAIQPKRAKGDVRPLANTFTQKMLDAGKTVIQRDMEDQPRLGANEPLLKLGIRSAIRIPLVHEGQIIGALGLHSKNVDAFGEGDQAFLERLAVMIGPAVANADLHSQLKAAMDQQEVIDGIARIVTSTLQIDQVYEEFGHAMRKLIDFDRAAISLINPDLTTFTRRYVYGKEIPGRAVGEVVPLEGSSVGEVMVTGKPLIREDIVENPRLATDFGVIPFGLNSNLRVPLSAEGRVIGTLSLRSTPANAFGAKELAILERLARQISPAILNAQQHELQLAAEEEVRKSRSQYQELYENAPVGYATIGRDGFVHDTNRRFQELFGFTHTELIDMPLTKLFSQSEGGRETALSVMEVFRRGESIQDRQARMTRKGGSDFWASITLAPVEDLEGLVSASRCIVMDVSHQVEEQEELKKLTQAVHQSPSGVVITDTEARIEYVNPKFTETTGYSMGEALGKTPRILQSGQTPREDYDLLWETFRKGEEWRGQRLNRRKNGELYWSQQLVVPIKDQQGNPTNYLMLEEDVTRRKQLEEQLLQSKKMETVGRMAGGIAHDFNNVLTTIIGYTSIAREKTPPESDIAGYLEEVLKGARRAAELTEQILSFSRSRLVGTENLNLNVLIENFAGMLRSLLADQVEMSVSLGPELWTFKGNEDQMRTVLANLASNAKEAMGGIGKLSLETKNCILSTEEAQSLNLPSGKYVLLSVADDGPGIPPEIMEHIFEPFFTTKVVGEGPGLGLSICHGIVSQCGGHLAATNLPERGVRFDAYLPAAENPPQE